MFKKSFFILKHRDTETQSKYEGAIDQQKLCISVSLCSIKKLEQGSYGSVQVLNLRRAADKGVALVDEEELRESLDVI